MNKDYLAVLDACSLVGGGLRDTLLRLAETPRLYVPKWSEDIINETVKTLQNRMGVAPDRTDHLVAELRQAFPEAWVCGYQGLQDSLRVHPKDRHVLAAAIKCSAQTIVTFNLKDFPPEGLTPFDIEAIHPDEFLVNQFYLDNALVTQKFTEQAIAIGRTVEEQLRAFVKHLPVFSQTVADALEINLDE
jgi:hypothetical protein